ncbi:unnamed protein product [Camellia sinensis]
MVGFEVRAVLADWTRNYNPTRNSTNPRNSTHPHNSTHSRNSIYPSDSIFDFTSDNSFGDAAAADDNATFCLVDSKSPSRLRVGPKWRFQQQLNHLLQRRNKEIEAKKCEVEKEVLAATALSLSL